MGDEGGFVFPLLVVRWASRGACSLRWGHVDDSLCPLGWNVDTCLARWPGLCDYTLGGALYLTLILSPPTPQLALNELAQTAASQFARDTWQTIPIISPTATAASLSSRTVYPNFFRTAPSDLAQAKAISDLALHFNFTTMGIVHSDDLYSLSLATNVEAEFSKRNGTLPTILDLGLGIEVVQAKMRESRLARWFLFGLSQDIDPFLEAALAAGMAGPNSDFTYIGGDSMSSSSLTLAKVGLAREGVLHTGLRIGSGPMLDLMTREEFDVAGCGLGRYQNAWFAETEDSSEYQFGVNSGQTLDLGLALVFGYEFCAKLALSMRLHEGWIYGGEGFSTCFLSDLFAWPRKSFAL